MPLIVVGLLVVSAAIVEFTARELHRSDEPRSTTQLETCLSEHEVPDLAIEGEALLEHACRAWVDDRSSPRAACVFARQDQLVEENAAKRVAEQCGVSAE